MCESFLTTILSLKGVGMKHSRLTVACLVWVTLANTAAWASALDGRWAGALTCSENVANRNPGFTIPLALTLSGTVGTSDRTDEHSVETFSYQRTPSGQLDIQSQGRLRSDTATRWVTRLSGDALNGTLELQGQMLAADGKTMVRERCSATLSRTMDTTLPPARVQAPQGTPHTGLTHRTFQIKAVAPKTPPKNQSATTPGPGGAPLGEGGVLYLPEDWLLGSGQPWHYRSTPRPQAQPVPVRPATPAEAPIVQRAEALMQQIESRVLVLLDQGEIVSITSTGGIRFESRLLSASMAKTMTALAAGKAICASRLSLGQRADAVIPALSGTDLGTAKLRDLLMMASGTTEPGERDYLGTTADETRFHLEGAGNLERLLATPGQSSAQRGVFSKIKPGERFSYKSRDPYTVAMMLEKTVGMPATRWVEEQLLIPSDVEHSTILATDRSGYFRGANDGMRLTLVDWIRLAIYIDKERKQDSCFGRFIRDMASTQIRAPGLVNHMSGYGYFTFTENAMAPQSFWAVGYGGQRIGWSTEAGNGRVFMMFSNSADRQMDLVYPIARDWMRLGSKPKN
jgi:CubicO group peptidase (beta-lactamase class C family)